MKINELHNQPVEADTYEASMALNQLLKIGKHAIKIHNMIDDSAEMEAWVGKKIDLAGDYVKKVHGYMQGENAGLYDDDGMTEDTLFGMKDPVISISDRNGKHLDTLAMSVAAKKYGFNPAVIRPQFKHQDKVKWNNLTLMAPIAGQPQPKGIMQRMFASEDDKQQASDKEVKMAKGVAFDKRYKDGNYSGAYKTINKIKPGLSDHPDVADALRRANEDAGEGHMSKSTLYHTAKYAIELMDMIKKGDDLEGWVQSKLNKAADYLQGVHNYEEYQKLNPYREELDANTLQKHAQVVQKNIDEILARETSLDDVDTKPGMMRILAKRVNEVEKEIAKENRKETDEVAPPGREKQVKKLKGKFKDKGAPYAIAWAQHNKHGKPKKEAELDEGIKDWAKNLAAAGIIVGAVAGLGSINNAIDNSVPAVKAMNTAYEMAVDSGNTELADQIKKDISATKLRLDIGKDLNFVKGMQDKYVKFMPTEGLAYESKLAIMFNQHIK